MPTHEKSPVLADAADVLSDQLRTHLRRMAALLHPHANRIERQFQRSLKQLQLNVLERGALAAITPGAVARILADGHAPASFFEQVEYHGRRLAKLNLPPSQIIAALAEYDRLLIPVLEELPPEEKANFQWVREQLQFCVILTLNNAYYQVRESETQAFYDLFRVELESRNLDELLQRFLATLAQFCRADAAHLFWLDEGVWRHKAAVASQARRTPVLDGLTSDGRVVRRLLKGHCWSWTAGGAPDDLVLDRAWIRRFESCWSVPLVDGKKLAGVVQFGFRKTYEWLPREQELLAAAAERCVVAAQKARLLEDLAEREEQVRTLAEHMMHVEEAERRRISRELHDEAGQSLLCVRLNLEMIEQTLPESDPRNKLAEVREMTERTILEIRRLIAALSPAVLDQLGLGAALRQLVTRFRQVHSAKVRLQLSRIQNLPKKLEIIVYRLVQECFNNIAKHSSAKHVNISAATADGKLRLYVEDDGVGFHVEEALEKRNSFGLSGIRERVALLGGTFRIESWPRTAAQVSAGGGGRVTNGKKNGAAIHSDGTEGQMDQSEGRTEDKAEGRTEIGSGSIRGPLTPNVESVRPEWVGPEWVSQFPLPARLPRQGHPNGARDSGSKWRHEDGDVNSRLGSIRRDEGRRNQRIGQLVERHPDAGLEKEIQSEELALVGEPVRNPPRSRSASGESDSPAVRQVRGSHAPAGIAGLRRQVTKGGAMPVGTRISIELPIPRGAVRR
ncbi:MAG: GAF domain-containing sensor histidine kinase [Bryobacterales bacterium]|nr:GAF domain-containing sensor histidine kinase [Bryobacterales bacterium]